MLYIPGGSQDLASAASGTRGTFAGDFSSMAREVPHLPAHLSPADGQLLSRSLFQEASATKQVLFSPPPGLGGRGDVSAVATARHIHIPSIQGNYGSLGHPYVCMRPCVYQLKAGGCHLGAGCRNCHMLHHPINRKLDKFHRDVLKRTNLADRLSIVIPLLRRRSAKEGLAPEFAKLILMLQRELESRSDVGMSDVAMQSLQTLRRKLSQVGLSTLVTMLGQDNLPTAIWQEFESIRAAVTWPDGLTFDL
mmetsp:Transcript_35494/g.66110  ORF Transcript_35494/g.66110 Transcript_35494/m.66110 type:complete len:250 (-) Transcript_35494:76-825(-)